MKRYLILILCCLITIARAENDPYPFTDKRDAAHFATFTKEIRCVVCQSQSIADSNAPLANDLREKIYRMMLEKKSDAEIKQYLVKRYGEFILLKPAFNKLTLILWIFPFLGIAMVFLVIIRKKF